MPRPDDDPNSRSAAVPAIRRYRSAAHAIRSTHDALQDTSDQRRATVFPIAHVQSKILLIRRQKVILDSDLAELYGVATSRQNEQVKRNIERFPSDFAFRLTSDEFADLKSHFAISSSTV